MATARDHNKSVSGRNTESTSNRAKDRVQINRILTEVGLNPTDYILSPLPEENSPTKSSSSHTSAFSSYPPQQEQDNQHLLKPQSQSLFASSRPLSYVEQPPPPPPQLAATQPSQSNRDQIPPTLQIPINQSQGPPPPPTSLGPSFPSDRPAPNIQNISSQSPPDMNQHIFSPRRSPPPLPTCYSPNPHVSTLSAEHYLQQINSLDNPPVKVVKPSTQNVVYRKEIRIRYLQPPTPPPPAPIIIREKRLPPLPPQSPLLIRERKPEARTPPPLTIRERPPTPPAPLEPYVIEKNIPAPPPQPRQVIIERLPTPPPKPRTVVFEKWLPYKKLKRPVLLQKAPPPDPIRPTRNVIIEYEPLKAFTVRRVIEEGVFRVDPHQYSSYNAHSHVGGDIRVVERIEDLPPPSEQLMRVLDEYNHPIQHCSSNINSYDLQSHHNLSEHVPLSMQHLLAGARPISNVEHLTSVSRASSIPAHVHERVLTRGHGPTAESPTIVPLQRSRSKMSDQAFHQYTPHDSPTRSHIDDAY